MSKFIIALAALLICSHPSHAADFSSGSLEDDINKELLDSELGAAKDDAPPEAEYPYPGAREEGINPADNPQSSPQMSPQTAPRTARAAQAPQYKGSPPVEPNQNIERPKSINEETGEYQYDTKVEAPMPRERVGGEQPRKTLTSGEYLYERDTQPSQFVGRPGQERPLEIRASGEYKYETEQSAQTGSASFRVGFFGPPMIENNSTDPKTTFEEIYTKDQLPVLFVDYELPITKKLGQLGLKVGSGVFFASGKGKFASSDPNRRADDVPLEKYTFFMLPNTATVIYRFQYKDGQTLVPYVEGGAGFFTFGEFRDDNSSPRFGGALTTVVSGGLNILMDWLDPQAIRNLDADYGINHVYLSLEARQIVGLNKSYDFTSSIFNAGFVMQF
jgi:hypothetical protein